MKFFDVMTIGSATQDVFVRSRALEEQKDPLAPDGLEVAVPMGSKLEIDDLTFATGGGAGNAAVTMSRFGLKTACVAAVGDDQIGETIVEELKRERVDVSFVRRDKREKSGYSVILLSGSGHRGILTYRGASQKLETGNLPRAIKTVWLYLTSFGGNRKFLDACFKFAEKTKAYVAWNPGVGELSLGIDVLRPYLKRTHVLLLNKQEAASLSDLPPRHASQVMNKLTDLTCGMIVVTDGERGAFCRAEGKTWRVGTLRGKRVNTTGAGDAFGSAFVAALAKGKDVKTALAAAVLNAHGVVTHMGAKAGILRGFPSRLFMRRVPIKEMFHS